jgi:hypothetical protein
MSKEDLEKLSPETIGQLNDARHEELYESIIILFKGELKNPVIETSSEKRRNRECKKKSD